MTSSYGPSPNHTQLPLLSGHFEALRPPCPLPPGQIATTGLPKDREHRAQKSLTPVLSTISSSQMESPRRRRGSRRYARRFFELLACTT
jgi:hypothetical protein